MNSVGNKCKSEHIFNTIKVYDTIAQNYYLRREELILHEEMNCFMQMLPSHGSILDAGCGNARDLMIFFNKGYDVFGVDFSDGQLNLAKKRVKDKPIILKKMNLIEIASLNNSFNGIWCNAVLQHFTDNEIIKILDGFRTLLLPNGVIACSFKVGNGIHVIEEPEFNNIKRFTNFHNLEAIEKIVKSANLKIIKKFEYNERERFNAWNRNLDFITTFLNV